MDREKWYTYYETLFSNEKEGNLAICGSINAGRHYPEWNKEEAERKILLELTYVWNIKKLRNGEYKLFDRAWGMGKNGGSS